MALDIGVATGPLTGARYRDSLNDGRRVFLNGERVDVTEHPAFAGVLRELCRLFDMQHRDEYQPQMTCASPETGHRISASYLLPRNAEELRAKRANAEVWAEETWGQLSATPEYLASAIVGLYDFRQELGAKDRRFGENAANYYRYAADHDLIVARATSDPQLERSELYGSQAIKPEPDVEVLEERRDGIVVRGVKRLVTLAPLAHEILVTFSSALPQAEGKRGVQWFAVPLNTPGITILSSEPRTPYQDDKGHPLASRYQEPDAVVFFQDVLVPWERVFLLYDDDLAREGAKRMKRWTDYSSHVRFYHRMWALVGVASMLAEAIGADGFRNIRDKLGELVLYPEVFKYALMGSEFDGGLTPGGLFAPSDNLALTVFTQHYTARILDLVKDMAGAGAVLQPSEADLQSPELQPLLEQYMGAKNLDATTTARLFRIAWDLIGDGGGVRQDLYERFLRGDLFVNRNQLYLNYDRTELDKRIKDYVSQPLPLGETPRV